jgi:hypothetical protein
LWYSTRLKNDTSEHAEDGRSKATIRGPVGLSANRLSIGFFALYGFGDEGFLAACPFILLLLVCLLQSVYPTLLGWTLLFGSSLAYALAVAFSPHNGPWGEYVFFFLCGAVPAAVLFFLRPTKKNPGPAE